MKSPNKLSGSATDSATSAFKEKASFGLIKISINQTILFVITNTYANVCYIYFTLLYKLSYLMFVT